MTDSSVDLSSQLSNLNLHVANGDLANLAISPAIGPRKITMATTTTVGHANDPIRLLRKPIHPMTEKLPSRRNAGAERAFTTFPYGGQVARLAHYAPRDPADLGPVPPVPRPWPAPASPAQPSPRASS